MHTEPSVQQLFDLSGKTAIVTGGTGYLGRCLANALAEVGSRVIVTSRDLKRAQSVASELPAVGPLPHAGVQLNHLACDELASRFAAITDQIGPVDILVNNGNQHTATDLSNCTPDDFTHQLANATGYFILSRLLRNHVVDRGAAGSIVMLGSMYGLVGSYPDAYEGITHASPVAYHALKGSLLQLTRHLAVYWAKDRVRVNSLSPGPFPAPTVSKAMVERLCTKSPMKRMGLPHELKGAIVFLASDASSYVTGHNLVVDGGWTAW